jgi:hypothetical protein
MNDTPQDPKSNVAFSETSNTQTYTQAQSNPFTSDIQGEFSSDFGTSTNAVSQIFKSGGFTAENRTKIVALGAVLVGLLLAFIFVSGEEDQLSLENEDQMAEMQEEGAEQEELAEGEEAIAEGEEAVSEETEDLAEGEGELAEGEAVEEGMEGEATEGVEAVTGAIALIGPYDGAMQPYDETSGPAEFSWDAPAERFNLSRSSTMQPLERSVNVNGATSYALENPYPGTFYWQVQNAEGLSEVRSFTIMAPEPRVFPVTQPVAGGEIAGNGGIVSWQAGEKIARYAVEVKPAGTTWANPAHRFQTSGTSISVNGVPPGAYDFRVGAFSEAAGRWEWQELMGVSVQ